MAARWFTFSWLEPYRIALFLAMLSFLGCRALEESPSVDRARERIESIHLEFHDFENQRSFAGHDVATRTDGRDVYVAYKVLGSGLPVVKATCFRVDEQGGVYLVGRYPGPTSRSLTDRDIDPRTCRGLR